MILMLIESRLRINDRNYFLGIELKYNKNGALIKSDNSYFDMGDLGVMIDFFETELKKEGIKDVYDNRIAYMNDVIYLYDRFPFLKYIKDVSYDKEGKITQIGYIDRDEIIDYINSNRIELNKWDKNNCICPMLYN